MSEKPISPLRQRMIEDMTVSLPAAPRTDPYGPDSGIRLLPRVSDGKALSCLPYASERLGHTGPALCPVCALLACIPLGPRPWLHRLRRRLPGIVRRLRGYYGGVRLPTAVHHRLRLLAFPMRTSAARITSAAGRPWDLPVPVQEASAHARVCDHAGSSGRSRVARPSVWRSSASWSSTRPFPRHSVVGPHGPTLGPACACPGVEPGARTSCLGCRQTRQFENSILPPCDQAPPGPP